MPENEKADANTQWRMKQSLPKLYPLHKQNPYYQTHDKRSSKMNP